MFVIRNVKQQLSDYPNLLRQYCPDEIQQTSRGNRDTEQL